MPLSMGVITNKQQNQGSESSTIEIRRTQTKPGVVSSWVLLQQPSSPTVEYIWLCALLFTVIRALFSLYVFIRRVVNTIRYQLSSAIYYQHISLQRVLHDVKDLEKIPKHLSTILHTGDRFQPGEDVDRLIDETANLAVWCASTGIPMLSVYEKNGVLKQHMPRVYDTVLEKFGLCFERQPRLLMSSPNRDNYQSMSSVENKSAYLDLRLISAQDGKQAVTNLTRTLAKMSQMGKLLPCDISHRLIDAELSRVVLPEPDLLILFHGSIELGGYPPWQLRLTEIFHLQDIESFGYQTFLKALQTFGKAKMRYGK